MPVKEIIAVDVGGTNTRFACATLKSGRPVLGPIRKYKVAEFPTFNACWNQYVRDEPDGLPAQAVIGLASPIAGAEIRLTNGHWTFRPDTIASELGLQRVKLVNDFAAVAHAIASLPLNQLPLLFGPDKPLPHDGIVTVLGPGTGLGVAMIAYRKGKPQVFATEAGHIDFAAFDRTEAQLAEIIGETLLVERVSVERIVSGPGLNHLYQAMGKLAGKAPPTRDDATLWQTALDGSAPAARAALAHFCGAYGSMSSNLAMAQGSSTVILAGSLTERLRSFLVQSSDFHSRFVAKGRFDDYMRAIPIRFAEVQEVGLYGAAAAGFRET